MKLDKQFASSRSGSKPNTPSFISNTRLKLAKNQANAKQPLKLNFCYLKIIDILHPYYHPKIIGDSLKNKQKNKSVCIHEIERD